MCARGRLQCKAPVAGNILSYTGPQPEPNSDGARATVLYDGKCAFCINLARRFASTAERARFQLLTLQAASRIAPFRNGLAAGAAEGFDSIVVFPAAGAPLRCGEAVRFMARYVWWALPLRILAALPAGMLLMDAGYRWVARNRACLSAACTTTKRPAWPGILAAVLLPVAAIALSGALPGWVRMWLTAGAFFFGFKLLTLWRVGPSAAASVGRRLAYLFGWVGMDARKFLAPAAPGRIARSGEWVRAGRSLVAGVVSLWLVAGLLPPEWPRARAWSGLIGLIWTLHFGLFHFLALGWRALGIAATPIMDSPTRSTSLAEFWGRRWNRGFRELSHGLIFGPLRGQVGSKAALLAAFLFSGVIHDLVISLPAGGGYGLPTIYFAMQGLGVWFERSRPGRRVGLGRGRLGWAFTLATTAAPLGLLFHGPFLIRTALPMIEALGAF